MTQRRYFIIYTLFWRIRFVNQYPLVLAAVGAILVLTLMLNWLSDKKPAFLWGLRALLAVYFAGVVYFTIFARAGGTASANLLLRPFTAIRKAFTLEGGLRLVNSDSLYQIFLNVMLFLPLGLLLPSTVTHERLWLTLWAGFLLSLIIEIMQYCFALGTAETDDLIHNVLGTALGYGLYKLQIWLLKHMKLRSQTTHHPYES